MYQRYLLLVLSDDFNILSALFEERSCISNDFAVCGSPTYGNWWCEAYRSFWSFFYIHSKLSRNMWTYPKFTWVFWILTGLRIYVVRLLAKYRERKLLLNYSVFADSTFAAYFFKKDETHYHTSCLESLVQKDTVITRQKWQQALGGPKKPCHFQPKRNGKLAGMPVTTTGSVWTNMLPNTQRQAVKSSLRPVRN